MAGESLARTHLFSLRAPMVNEEERAQFQTRLALTFLLVFVLAGTFWTVATISVAVKAPSHVHHNWDQPAPRVQLATTALALIAWLYTRSGRHSPRTLDAVDAAGAVLLSLGWAFMVAVDPGHSRAELVGLLATTYTLVVRSAFIPSTPARTALLGAIAHAPLIAVTHLQYVSGRIPSGSPLEPAVYVAIWALIGVGAMTATTWVIYGLRAQVRRAMQLGQYFLEDKIGEGGMGAVYRASHAMLRRPTAIKLLSESTGSAVERFEREVQITARLTHPNTVAVFDYGRTPDGVFYYAMEYLDGISLEELVDASGPQPPARVVHVMQQVCGALREAHAEGLVHRDIKPANVMLTTRGGVADFVKVLDFGLVKETVARGIGAGDAAVTNASAILGTPHYMAPESILDPGSVDGRADIYSLGATAFFLLTGKRVFEGSNLVEVCSKHIHEKPAAPSSIAPGIPAALDRVVLACLAKKAEERPSDARALAAMLQETGIEAWTETAATRWWAKHGATRSRRDLSTSAVFGDTVAVAIESRVRAEKAG